MPLTLELVRKPEMAYTHCSPCRRVIVIMLLLLLGVVILYILPWLFYFLLDYSPSYLLYLISLIAVVEFATKISRKLKRTHTVIHDTGFRYARLGCCALLSALIVFAGACSNNHPRIKEVSIQLPRKSSTIRELSILFASDFHLEAGDERIIERFVVQANAVHPDLILIGGDLLGENRIPDLDKLTTEFRRLIAKHGVYAIMGNHDMRRSRKNVLNRMGPDFFEKSGIKLLKDSVEKVDDAFYLAGLQNEFKPIEDLLKAALDDFPVILLKHTPRHLESISRSGVDLQLSGHTHNGQLFPFNLMVMPLHYELAYGAKIKRNTLFIVSSGVHFWDPPVNTQGYSEILHIRAVFQSDAKMPRLVGIE